VGGSSVYVLKQHHRSQLSRVILLLKIRVSVKPALDSGDVLGVIKPMLVGFGSSRGSEENLLDNFYVSLACRSYRPTATRNRQVLLAAAAAVINRVRLSVNNT
jgi:hypothetical protein